MVSSSAEDRLSAIAPDIKVEGLRLLARRQERRCPRVEVRAGSVPPFGDRGWLRRQVTSLGVMNMYITSEASESGIGTLASECSAVLAKSSHQISAYPSHGTSGA